MDLLKKSAAKAMMAAGDALVAKGAEMSTAGAGAAPVAGAAVGAPALFVCPHCTAHNEAAAGATVRCTVCTNQFRANELASTGRPSSSPAGVAPEGAAAAAVAPAVAMGLAAAGMLGEKLLKKTTGVGAGHGASSMLGSAATSAATGAAVAGATKVLGQALAGSGAGAGAGAGTGAGVAATGTVGGAGAGMGAAAAAVRAVCPYCATHSDAVAGASIRCNRCGNQFEVPSGGAGHTEATQPEGPAAMAAAAMHLMGDQLLGKVLDKTVSKATGGAVKQVPTELKGAATDFVKKNPEVVVKAVKSALKK
jgi:hypothetical protein